MDLSMPTESSPSIQSGVFHKQSEYRKSDHSNDGDSSVTTDTPNKLPLLSDNTQVSNSSGGFIITTSLAESAKRTKVQGLSDYTQLSNSSGLLITTSLAKSAKQTKVPLLSDSTQVSNISGGLVIKTSLSAAAKQTKVPVLVNKRRDSKTGGGSARLTLNVSSLTADKRAKAQVLVNRTKEPKPGGGLALQASSLTLNKQNNAALLVDKTRDSKIRGGTTPQASSVTSDKPNKIPALEDKNGDPITSSGLTITASSVTSDKQGNIPELFDRKRLAYTLALEAALNLKDSDIDDDSDTEDDSDIDDDNTDIEEDDSDIADDSDVIDSEDAQSDHDPLAFTPVQSSEAQNINDHSAQLSTVEAETYLAPDFGSASTSYSDRAILLSNYNHLYNKTPTSVDQGKDVLVIGGDLLIAKSQNLPAEKIVNSCDRKSEDTESTSFEKESTYNSVTIKTINYKCAVLQEHSRVCGCGSPRLHEYLSSQHRCSPLCVASQPNTSTFTPTIHHVISISRSLGMTGRARGKHRGRKLTNPRRINNPNVTETLIRNGCPPSSSHLVSQDNEEPESELLGESECEWLPTTMSSLEGVEYIVLDDDALNLSRAAEGVTGASPDALKSKINIIYQDIDDKNDVTITEDKSTPVREVKQPLPKLPKLTPIRRAPAVTNPGTPAGLVSGIDESNNGKPVEGTTDEAGSSSLAVVCTNHSPSIKDIFGDINIKDEPLDDIKDDMSVEDFSKQIKMGSVEDFICGNFVSVGEPKTEENDEKPNKGLFAKLIKEENTESEEVNSYVSSDDSLGPLQIDEDRIVPADPIDEHMIPVRQVPQLTLPTVNIISPFKIKILLGNNNPKIGGENEILGPDCLLGSSIVDRSMAWEGQVLQQGITVASGVPTLPGTKATVVTTNTLSVVKSLTCKYCGTTCSDAQSLAEHFENHQKEGLIICYFCQKSFGDKTGMKRHMRTHTGEKPYQCKVCGKRFSLPGNFKKHRDIHEDRRTEPCTVCGKTFRRKEHLKYHMRTHTGEKPYTCSECGTSFTARYSLQIHMNIHLGKKPYKCTYCSKAFSDKSTMRKHIRVHTGEKPFRCQECRRCFGESGTLAAHMATHRSERPFQCNKCTLAFKTSGGLRQHDKVHTGDKQFACRFCGAKFLQKYNMTMHERIHTGEKPYACPHCSRSFRSRSCLSKHVVLHGGEDERRFGCDHCSSRFYRKAHLRRHIDMHLGIKNYECSDCDKKFCTRGTLKNHLKTFHSHGARRFPCNWCGRVFKRQIYVSTHICTKAPIKTEGGEPIDNMQPGTSYDMTDYNSSDSDGSSVDVKSEPEDDIIEEMEGEGMENFHFYSLGNEEDGVPRQVEGSLTTQQVLDQSHS